MMSSGVNRAGLPVWLIVVACATIAAIGMGLRQVMGLYLKPVTEWLGVGREAFALAVAIANIVWGLAAPFVGAVSDKYGTGRVVVFGAVCTAAGLAVMYAATSDLDLFISGVLMGFGVAGAGVNAMVGAVGRAVPPGQRTAAIAALGMGSGIGIFVALPYAHLLIEQLGWQASLLVLAGTAMVMLPLAFAVSGKPTTHALARQQTLREAVREAFRHPSFWLLNAGFFVCGFHVVFYGVHLPAYVADKGLGNDVAVIALTVVGIGNLVGTYLAGQSAKIIEKRVGLSLIYLGRALIFLGFLFLPITATTVILLSAGLGLLWLSTVPLTSGLVATFFGPTWMTMLYGIVFFSHQVGSFLGVWLAGRLFDITRSYDAMWWISVALGLFAALVHWPIKERPVARLAAPTVPA
ncbi:MAG TPA: MFS transporter [Hyphomicrobiaceae bacterium]|jgi:predicted MFS family arabinose efflux permease|nr:MFS transporter [Hyphomicrobiaceae bacterium]